jgi:2'-5' RNA ligase
MHQSSLFGDPAPRERTDLHRLFFALWPQDEVRAALQAAARGIESARQPGGRMIGAHRYHLTMQFLGDFDQLPEDIVERAKTAAAVVNAAAFDLHVNQAGSFKNNSIPWWLGCDRQPAELATLWDRLGVALAKTGVRIKAGHRADAPHITIVRDANAHLHPPVAIEPIVWRVADFVLIHSQLGSRNAYNVLGQWSLTD